MPFSEIALETILAALESTRGTAIAAPTHLLNVDGFPQPDENFYAPMERRGTRAKQYRVKRSKNGLSWEFSGACDVNELLFWLNCSMMTLAAPSSTPTNGILTRLWAFIRLMTADTEKAFTLWYGDPNIQIWRNAFNMVTEISIENDSMADDGHLTFGVKGNGGVPAKVSAPTVPASIAGDIPLGAGMGLAIDVASAIGTTAITGRLLKSKLTVPTGRTFKRIAAGTAADLAFTHVGIEQAFPTLELTIEVPDMVQYDLWAAASSLKIRVTHYGTQIEAVTPTYYNYVQHDTYGPCRLKYDTNAGSNRVITLTQVCAVDSTLASDVNITVENQRTTV